MARECRGCDIGLGAVGVLFGLIAVAVGLDLMSGGRLAAMLGRAGELAPVTELRPDDAA